MQGDANARDDVLEYSGERLRQLTRKMLNDFPVVRRWSETDDVLQNALLRLLNALQTLQPANERDFLGLAALQIRRELIDLARRFKGPHGLATNHDSNPAEDRLHQPLTTFDPADLAQWTEIHEAIGELPDAEREAVDLIFYQGLSQDDSAGILGVSVRTLQRRWHSALVRLDDRRTR